MPKKKVEKVEPKEQPKSFEDRVLALLDSEIRYWSKSSKAVGLLFLSDERERRSGAVAALKRVKGKMLKEVFGRQRSK